MLHFKLLILVILITIVSSQQAPASIQYEWNYINFTWPTTEAYNKALSNNDYIKANNPIAGIKLWKGNLYLTVPRWLDGVPATLLVTPAEPVNGNKSPLLKPYPNWDMQTIKNCSAFQFVQSMEIDPLGRMWVIDTGRISTITKNPKNYCPPRLVILDLENEGQIILDYVFPEEIANRETTYLNDIVLESEDGGFAYITDTDNDYPGIIVFSLATKTSWKVTDKSMIATAANFTVKYDNTSVSTPFNVDSIALSSASIDPNNRKLYYSPLSSLEIFSVSTQILKTAPTDISNYVTIVDRKKSQTDGMIIDARGWLYFGQLADNGVAVFGTRNSNDKDWLIFQDDKDMQWPDTFAIDENCVLWVVCNRLQRELKGIVDTNEINFRVIKLANVGARSYLYYEDGSTPFFGD